MKYLRHYWTCFTEWLLGPPCDHDWVDYYQDYESLQGQWVCTKCNAWTQDPYGNKRR